MLNTILTVIAGGLLLFFPLIIILRLLDADDRKADFAAAMRPTRRNYVLFGLFIVVAAGDLFGRWPDLQAGTANGLDLYFMACDLIIGAAAAVLLALNLTRAHQAHSRP